MNNTLAEGVVGIEQMGGLLVERKSIRSRYKGITVQQKSKCRSMGFGGNDRKKKARKKRKKLERRKKAKP